MKRDEYAAFFERLGHRVVRTRSAAWYDARGGIFMSLPHAAPLEPDPAELREIFRGHAWGVRFPAPADGPGRLSYALVLDDAQYDLHSLSANSRSKVRRGLKWWDVRRIDSDHVRKRGEQANAETLARVALQYELCGWDQWWDAVAATESAEVWAALDGSTLGAYLVVVIVDGVAELLIARSRDDARARYANHALVFTAAREYMNRADVGALFFGLESLEPEGGVDQFKTSLGFMRRRLRQRIVFHPAAERVADIRLVRAAIGTAARWWPQRETLRKLDGLLAFHAAQKEMSCAS